MSMRQEITMEGQQNLAVLLIIAPWNNYAARFHFRNNWQKVEIILVFAWLCQPEVRGPAISILD